MCQSQAQVMAGVETRLSCYLRPLKVTGKALALGSKEQGLMRGAYRHRSNNTPAIGSRDVRKGFQFPEGQRHTD